MSLDLEASQKILVQGEGGDFSGFIEQSQLTMRKFGMINSRSLVPNYTIERIMIDIDLTGASVIIHPTPRDDLDYDFSEHARIFHDHGFAILVHGENVTLTVSKRKPAKMFGDVYLLIGTRIESEEDHYKALRAIIWLHAFQRRFGGK